MLVKLQLLCLFQSGFTPDGAMIWHDLIGSRLMSCFPGRVTANNFKKKGKDGSNHSITTQMQLI